MNPGHVFLVLVALLFAWSMGAHYTGAVMGMPYASRAIRIAPALGIMAVLTVIGAALASGGVQKTVGLHIVDSDTVTVVGAIVMVLSAAILTTIYTYYKVPSSTIQIFVFSIVSTGLAARVTIHWHTILNLAVLWVIAPFAAVALGFCFTYLFDLIVPREQAREETRLIAGSETVTAVTRALSPAARALPACLVVVGAGASFTLGANDVLEDAIVCFLHDRFDDYDDRRANRRPCHGRRCAYMGARPPQEGCLRCGTYRLVDGKRRPACTGPGSARCR